jgi:hypothetical protein
MEMGGGEMSKNISQIQWLARKFEFVGRSCDASHRGRLSGVMRVTAAGRGSIMIARIAGA